MDDEQYFSKVQADVTERTIQDVTYALDTLKDPLVALKTSNKATPTSANTAEGDANEQVDFQKSVVATQRFDISEIGWEERMMAFVNERLGNGGALPQHGPIQIDAIPSNEYIENQEVIHVAPPNLQY